MNPLKITEHGIIIDPYMGCSRNCVFCASKHTYGIRNVWTPDPKPVDFNKFNRALVKNIRKVYDEQRLPSLGIHCDPFCNAERVWGNTRTFLDVLKTLGVPVNLFTHGVDFNPDWLFDGSIVTMTIYTTDDQLGSTLQAEYVPFETKMNKIEELTNNGTMCIISLSPYILGVTEPLPEMITNITKRLGNNTENVGFSAGLLYPKTKILIQDVSDKLNVQISPYTKGQLDAFQSVFNDICVARDLTFINFYDRQEIMKPQR